MRDIARRSIRGAIASSVTLGVLLGGSIALPGPSGAVAVPTPCTATIDPGPTVVLGTDQLITVTGLTPNGDYTITQTHNGDATGPSPSTADANGGVSFTLSYALGTWTDAWQDTTTGGTCSVSWTVIEETPTTTTTTLAPTTTTAAPSAALSPAATAIPATPTFTG
jgi:hypothetical protein